MIVTMIKKKKIQESILKILDEWMYKIAGKKVKWFIRSDNMIEQTEFHNIIENAVVNIAYSKISSDEVLGLLDTSTVYNKNSGLIFSADSFSFNNGVESITIKYEKTGRIDVRKNILEFIGCTYFDNIKKVFNSSNTTMKFTCLNLNALRDCLEEIKSMIRNIKYEN